MSIPFQSRVLWLGLCRPWGSHRLEKTSTDVSWQARRSQSCQHQLGHWKQNSVVSETQSRGVSILSSYLTTKLLPVLKTSWNTDDWMRLKKLNVKAPWNCLGMDPPTDFSLTSPKAGQSLSPSVTSNQPVVLTRNMPMYGFYFCQIIFVLEEQSLQGNCSQDVWWYFKSHSSKYYFEHTWGSLRLGYAERLFGSFLWCFVVPNRWAARVNSWSLNKILQFFFLTPDV